MTRDDLNSPDRLDAIRAAIVRKPGLRDFYVENYRKYLACLAQIEGEGHAVEIGAGGGILDTVTDEIERTDIIPYPGIDRIVDATAMPFADQSVKLIAMLNVFHHIPDAEAFLDECQRTLIPGGRVLIIDQHRGFLSGPILKHFHHEPWDAERRVWRFESSGPLSGANGALAWMVFQRDCDLVRTRFPELELLRYEPHTPLRYWLSGGLKSWSLLPAFLVRPVKRVERAMLKISDNFGSFVDIELIKSG